MHNDITSFNYFGIWVTEICNNSQVIFVACDAEIWNCLKKLFLYIVGI